MVSNLNDSVNQYYNKNYPFSKTNDADIFYQPSKSRFVILSKKADMLSSPEATHLKVPLKFVALSCYTNETELKNKLDDAIKGIRVVKMIKLVKETLENVHNSFSFVNFSTDQQKDFKNAYDQILTCLQTGSQNSTLDFSSEEKYLESKYNNFYKQYVECFEWTKPEESALILVEEYRIFKDSSFSCPEITLEEIMEQIGLKAPSEYMLGMPPSSMQVGARQLPPYIIYSKSEIKEHLPFAEAKRGLEHMRRLRFNLLKGIKNALRDNLDLYKPCDFGENVDSLEKFRATVGVFLYEALISKKISSSNILKNQIDCLLTAHNRTWKNTDFELDKNKFEALQREAPAIFDRCKKIIERGGEDAISLSLSETSSTGNSFYSHSWQTFDYFYEQFIVRINDCAVCSMQDLYAKERSLAYKWYIPPKKMIDQLYLKNLVKEVLADCKKKQFYGSNKIIEVRNAYLKKTDLNVISKKVLLKTWKSINRMSAPSEMARRALLEEKGTQIARDNAIVHAIKALQNPSVITIPRELNVEPGIIPTTSSELIKFYSEGYGKPVIKVAFDFNRNVSFQTLSHLAEGNEMIHLDLSQCPEMQWEGLLAGDDNGFLDKILTTIDLVKDRITTLKLPTVPHSLKQVQVDFINKYISIFLEKIPNLKKLDVAELVFDTIISNGLFAASNLKELVANRSILPISSRIPPQLKIYR